MKKYRTVEEVIADADPELRPTLEALRAAIRKAIPDVEERISYNMPGYRLHGVVMWWSVFKNHYSLFFRPAVKDHFAEELSAYSQTKSAIHIPKNKRFPVGLLTRMVRYVARQNQQKLPSRSA